MIRTCLLTMVFLRICSSQWGFAGENAAIPSASPEQIQATIDRAIGYLQTESSNWLKTRKCAACHHAGIPLWALSEADQNGYKIDKTYLLETLESLLGTKDKLLSSRIFPNPADPPDPRPQGQALNMGLSFLAIAARSTHNLTEGQQNSLRLMADEIVQKQQSDGSWEFFAGLRRPPINESKTTDVAWNIMALYGETGIGSSDSQRLSLGKAIEWFEVENPKELHQDKALRLILGARFKKPREALKTSIDDLLLLQREDGGWSQTVPELKSDAFATGQSLYALAEAGYGIDHPEVQRGIDFLIATQAGDGTWPMISRSTPNGEPGSSTLMSPILCAASSWAVLGLTKQLPQTAPK